MVESVEVVARVEEVAKSDSIAMAKSCRAGLCCAVRCVLCAGLGWAGLSGM